MPPNPFRYVDNPAEFKSNDDVTISWNYDSLICTNDYKPFVAIKTPN